MKTLAPILLALTLAACATAWPPKTFDPAAIFLELPPETGFAPLNDAIYYAEAYVRSAHDGASPETLCDIAGRAYDAYADLGNEERAKAWHEERDAACAALGTTFKHWTEALE